MKLFNVFITDTGEELCIAARNKDHAAEVFVTFWFARTGEAPGEFHLGAGAPETYAIDKTIDDVARATLAGVIVRETDGSTRFEPAIG